MGIRTTGKRHFALSTILDGKIHFRIFTEILYDNFNFSIDATAESGRLGRLVNHSRVTPNMQTKVVIVKDTPRLLLVAKKDIEPGTELLYDYGDRSKESLLCHPWLAL